MADKRSAWNQLENKDVSETIRYRDVYEDQQLQRRGLGHTRSMTSRVILTAVLTVIFFFIVWITYSLIEAVNDQVAGTAPALDNYLPNTVLAFYTYYMARVTLKKVFYTVVISLAFFAGMLMLFYRSLQVQNADEMYEDISDYMNDQHIAVPEELQAKFDWFPDVGATSDIQFSSMISHLALDTKGLKNVQVAKRANKDILDEDGDIAFYKGDILRDENGEIIFETKPLIDKAFMHDLFKSSGIPRIGKLRKFWDARRISYNPDGSNRDKLGKYATVADLINADWELPYYEPQRPGGAYLVDTAPVNTMGATC